MTSSTSNSEHPTRRGQLLALKKFALRILLPFGILAVIACWGMDWAVRTQLIAKTPSHGAAKLTRIQAENPGEIPVIGSSRALGSYIPDTLGPQFYNYGINGIGYAMMDVFVKLECAKKGKTTPILISCDYDMFVSFVGEPNNYLPHSHIPEVRRLMVQNKHYSWWWRIPGIRYFGSLDSYMKEHLDERLELTKRMNKGAAIEKTVLSSAEFAKAVKLRRDAKHLWRPNWHLLDSLYQRMEQNPQRPFILVVGPYHKAYYEASEPKGLPLAQKYLRRAEALPNCTVLRFDGYDWPDSLFYNTTHLSLVGASKFSQMVRDSLLASGLIAPQIPVSSPK